MPAYRVSNRAMFWRIVRRLLTAQRGRLFVILLALGAGAAVAATLLNLQVDARRRLTTEFRALGANVLIAPRSENSAHDSALLDQRIAALLPPQNDGNEVLTAPFLYGIASIRRLSTSDATPGKSTPAVIAGFSVSAGSREIPHGLDRILPSQVIASQDVDSLHARVCEVGQTLARTLDLHPGARVTLESGDQELLCSISQVRSFGGSEDSQLFLDLSSAQTLLRLPGKLSVIQASVAGKPASIDRYISNLAAMIPDAEVRPIRQFTEAEATIYGRISGILDATVVIVLVLTGLCVMAAMTNVAMERKNDVGLMKAIGGSNRRVLRLFLMEAALLGLLGGAIGAVVGILLSMGLGKAVFGIAAQPRLIVYPVTVSLTVIVAIVGAYPLKRLTHIRPAAVFRGEA